MKAKLEKMLRSNVAMCVLVVILICLISTVFAADVKIKGGKVKPNKLELPNDTYLTAKNFADTNSVDLIKADINDVAVLADGAVLAAATQSGDGDRTISDKKYVDDQVATISLSQIGNTVSLFGTYTTNDTDANALTEETDYKATCDGLIHTFCGGRTTNVWVSTTQSDVTNKVSSKMRMAGTAGQYVGGMYGGCMVAIKKNEFVRVAWGASPIGTPSTHFGFMPIGSTGGLEEQ